MPKRCPIVVGNWKLNKTVAEALELVTAIKNQLGQARDIDVGVAPVYPALAAVAKRLDDSKVFVAGQNCFWEERGAWTGEVAPSLLLDVGCKYVILGHSERRQHFGETDEAVGKRARAALDAGLCVILCVGETEAQRDGGQTDSVIARQLNAALVPLGDADLARVVIAYEPVWAIGTGRTATPAQAQDVHAQIRSLLAGRFGDTANTVRIQYGGSVKPQNAESLMSQPDIDGALVGGASLSAEDFVAVVRATKLASAGQMG